MNLSLPDYSQTHLLVAGDLMLDRYWMGNTSRISPEAPVPVVHIQNHLNRPGGAGNVALNLRALGANCTLLSALGDDEAGKTLMALLAESNIKSLLEPDPELETITKLRIISNHQQLIRLDFEQGLPDLYHSPLRTKFLQALAQHQAVIFSDYAKGTLRSAKTLIALAREMGNLVIVDPKHADFSQYQGANFITPNMKEFEAVVGPCESETTLVNAALAQINAHGLDGLLITRGAKGMTLVQKSGAFHHIPTHAQEVYDVTGAGDTVIATLAASLAAGKTAVEATHLANIAAGIVVAKLGSATASHAELEAAIHPQEQKPSGLATLETLKAWRQTAKAAGETVVMTNGCFDLLHPGHITYLKQAKALGQRLIVAVNSDASVKRLKGHQRPINTLSARMLLLEALEAVDWVIAFEEDTPYNLIAELIPDVLVKGGDWQPDQIVGSEVVLAAGGEVRSLPFVTGNSTTTIIEKIRQSHAESPSN